MGKNNKRHDINTNSAIFPILFNEKKFQDYEKTMGKFNRNMQKRENLYSPIPIKGRNELVLCLSRTLQ